MKLKNWFKKYWLGFLIIGILAVVFFPKYCGFSYGGLLRADAVLKREECSCLGIKYGTFGGRFNLWRILDGGETHFCVGIPLGRTCFEWVANVTNDFSSEKQTECKRTEPRCGIENCHGFEIPCGSNIPEVCSDIYIHGDFCRQYVKCEVINGVCQLVKSEKFEKCKSCVEKCSEDFKDKFLKWDECESKCRVALTLEDKVIIRKLTESFPSSLLFDKFTNIIAATNSLAGWRRGAITKDKISLVVFNFFKPHPHSLLLASVEVEEFLTGINIDGFFHTTRYIS